MHKNKTSIAESLRNVLYLWINPKTTSIPLGVSLKVSQLLQMM